MILGDENEINIKYVYAGGRETDDRVRCKAGKGGLHTLYWKWKSTKAQHCIMLSRRHKCLSANNHFDEIC